MKFSQKENFKILSIAPLIALEINFNRDHSQKGAVLIMFNPIYLTHFEDVQCQSGVNHIYEGKITVYQGKSYTIAKRNVYMLYLETNRNTTIQLYKSNNYNVSVHCNCLYCVFSA